MTKTKTKERGTDELDARRSAFVRIFLMSFFRPCCCSLEMTG
jgi:hypothetical protein